MNDRIHIVCARCGSVNRLPRARLGQGPRCGQCHRPLLDGEPFELNGDNVRAQIERNELPVLVDFWAPWCGPCRMMAPVFAQAAARFRTEARFAKLDTEAEPAVAAQFGIRSIPTLILFRQGREVDRLPGARDLRGLSEWLAARL